MCPECGGDSKVYETRKVEGEIYRRRVCKERPCRHKFISVERITKKMPMAVLDKSIARLNKWKETK